MTERLTFTAVVTTHRDDPSMILGNLLYQTRKADEIIVLWSDLDPIDVALLEHDFPAVWFGESENQEDWGHAKREMGLILATSDALGFFNADDSYDLRYIELMMGEIEDGADVAYCSWNTIPRCGFSIGSSTSGNFVVRTEIARAAGYTDRHYEADGTFIERIKNQATAIARVDDLLYFHNTK